MNEKNFRFQVTLLSSLLLFMADHAAGQVAFTRVAEAAASGRRSARLVESRQPMRPDPSLQPSITSGTQLIIESGPISFGEVVAGQSEVRTDALIVRVFADRDWELRLIPESASIGTRGATPAMGMLEWKSPLSSRWSGMRAGLPVVVSRGRGTGPSGEVVPVDLRLRLSDRDSLGQYGFNLRLSLETNR